MSNNNVKFVERKRNGIQPITASQVKNIAKIIFSLNPYEKWNLENRANGTLTSLHTSNQSIQICTFGRLLVSSFF